MNRVLRLGSALVAFSLLFGACGGDGGGGDDDDDEGDGDVRPGDDGDSARDNNAGAGTITFAGKDYKLTFDGCDHRVWDQGIWAWGAKFDGGKNEIGLTGAKEGQVLVLTIGDELWGSNEETFAKVEDDTMTGEVEMRSMVTAKTEQLKFKVKC